MQHPIPELLILSEEGDWEQPDWSSNPDDQVFIPKGWQVRTYEGRRIYGSDRRSNALHWLLISGYTDTGDGAHFRHQSLFSEGESTPVLVDVSDSVEQFISERFNALQKEMKQD